MPPYFSWIEDHILAASAQPFHHPHMQYLRSHGIHLIVNIDTDILPNSSLFKHVCFSIAELCYPTFEQIIDFINLVLAARDHDEPVLIQSIRGQGTLAIFIACYLAVRWTCSAEVTINSLIKMRPASFDNDIQKANVKHFVTYWDKCHSQLNI
ncbi:unnamed protein product [Rotaria sordida]|uniref:Swiss Army Knife protein DSP-PTPase phosphatase domain-containing protein n=1 Tax=Rotaria sordida TaxID=392033 RepID=A0A819J7U1_9BILA|nr:unnamed protein product [Rotaria sordida]CAF0856051.1 unnamed protein product [Rotaria sordida]CAF0867588.1 unnamed protein product [Rotaria sordida]CAF0915956.1 unnamed protein product [Rotaria sordida]CAF3476102.1 unnamed protein product [Rotaria sordida]